MKPRNPQAGGGCLGTLLLLPLLFWPHATEPAGPLQPGELRRTLLLATATLAFFALFGLFCWAMT